MSILPTPAAKDVKPKMLRAASVRGHIEKIKLIRKSVPDDSDAAKALDLFLQPKGVAGLLTHMTAMPLNKEHQAKLKKQFKYTQWKVLPTILRHLQTVIDSTVECRNTQLNSVDFARWLGEHRTIFDIQMGSVPKTRTQRELNVKLNDAMQTHVLTVQASVVLPELKSLCRSYSHRLDGILTDYGMAVKDRAGRVYSVDKDRAMDLDAELAHLAKEYVDAVWNFVTKNAPRDDADAVSEGWERFRQDVANYQGKLSNSKSAFPFDNPWEYADTAFLRVRISDYQATAQRDGDDAEVFTRTLQTACADALSYYDRLLEETQEMLVEIRGRLLEVNPERINEQ